MLQTLKDMKRFGTHSSITDDYCSLYLPFTDHSSMSDEEIIFRQGFIEDLIGKQILCQFLVNAAAMDYHRNKSSNYGIVASFQEGSQTGATVCLAKPNQHAWYRIEFTDSTKKDQYGIPEPKKVGWHKALKLINTVMAKEELRQFPDINSINLWNIKDDMIKKGYAKPLGEHGINFSLDLKTLLPLTNKGE